MQTTFVTFGPLVPSSTKPMDANVRSSGPFQLMGLFLSGSGLAHRGLKAKVWMVEGGTPNTLLRRGLTRKSLVRVAGRNGSC